MEQTCFIAILVNVVSNSETVDVLSFCPAMRSQDGLGAKAFLRQKASSITRWHSYERLQYDVNIHRFPAFRLSLCYQTASSEASAMSAAARADTLI